MAVLCVTFKCNFAFPFCVFLSFLKIFYLDLDPKIFPRWITHTLMSTKERARLKRVTINGSILFPNLFNIQHVHSNAATIHISDMFTVVIKFFLEEICVFVSRMSNCCNLFKKCEQFFRFEFFVFRQFLLTFVFVYFALSGLGRSRCC